MGKTPKPKAKTQSVHSRASRRAVSPSLNIDKSLTSLPRPESPSTTPQRSVLSTQPGSGVSKRKSKSKPKTRAQRLRQEKGMERAEVVMDKTEKKVTKSFSKGKAVNWRKAAWDELNVKMPARKDKTLSISEDKAVTEPSTEDITITKPEQSTVATDAPEDPAQDAVMNAAIDLKEDEEIT